MTVVMITMMWQRFNESPTSTTIESTNYPISKVEFPAITVCNLNKIREESAKEVIKILWVQNKYLQILVDLTFTFSLCWFQRPSRYRRIRDENIFKKTSADLRWKVTGSK